ncbi:unnamed protein product [Pylaiella littoralis]
MKAMMICLIALMLPFPAFTFIAPSVVRPPASIKTRHRILATSPRRAGTRAPAVLMTQAVSLSSTVGSGEPIPAVTTNKDAPASQELNRSKLGLHLKVGSKVINLYGLLFAGQAWLTAVLMFPLCFLAALVGPIFDWRRMRPPTLVALLWGRMTLLNMGVRPKVEGLELLPPEGQAVVFVANHGSYLDIPVSNFLPRLCKYLMKAELLWLPIVGWKAVLARDIFVHRQTQSSFRRLLKSTTRSLKAGNSIMTFPEGTRSRDGRLGQFKRGPFTMAQRVGVPIVPVTITGVTDAMPPFAMAPLRKPRNVRLVVHPAIPTEGRPIKEVIAEARRAVADGLEDWQKPKPDDPPPPTPPSQ